MSDCELPFTRDDYSAFAKDGYSDRRQEGGMVTINGVDYRVLAKADDPSGFQGIAYRSLDENKLVISYRGTEAIKPKLWDQPVKDLGTDYVMVRDQFNRQESDADAFTRRVFDLVREKHPNWNLSEHITVTGHSLGGTHAQMMAARYGLGGMAYNAYGAVDIGSLVPEGQPANAPSFINHVRATDVVSAGNRHYGSVVGYATEQDIANLQFGGYLDAPNPAHPPNPLLAASLTAHFVNNFSPDPGGQTVMTEANEARYRQYQGAIEH
ncbi:hypothetical protein [Dyella japonica]|uniref:Lipase (Class 3) n=1 Tax=Dyella japonica TaxID=231455 RepID=A0ABV2JW84_9GAMM